MHYAACSEQSFNCELGNVQYELCCVHCSKVTVQSANAVCSVKCVVCREQCTVCAVFSVQFVECGVQCAMFSVRRALCSVQLAL